ncbi:MAG: ArsR/SmtB family transcription factor, partial [Acidimicrobiales bacterium]
MAALVGNRARYAMLQALLDGSERPAGELARAAGVSAATASGHLQRLVAGRIIESRSCGRHRYFRLAGPLVAAALEALSLIAPPVEVRSLRQSSAATAMSEARSCYDHLAGRAGIALRDSLLTSGALVAEDTGYFGITECGIRLLENLGLNTDSIVRSRRMLARDCLD